jgi:transcriptional regulatory protein LevR
MPQITLDALSDLELSEMICQIYENLARDQQNLINLKTEIAQRKEKALVAQAAAKPETPK